MNCLWKHVIMYHHIILFQEELHSDMMLMTNSVGGGLRVVVCSGRENNRQTLFCVVSGLIKLRRQEARVKLGPFSGVNIMMSS